jgi:hypothetical protein
VLKDNRAIVTAAVTIDEIKFRATVASWCCPARRSRPICSRWRRTATLADSVHRRRQLSELRFVISDAYIEVDNGDGTTSIYASSPTYAGLPVGAQVDGNLQMPSMGTSGLKVKLPSGGLTVSSGGSTIMVVDFDVSQSFGQKAGNSGQWVMHPVVHATDIQLTGSATVTLALDPSVTLPIINNVQTTLADFTVTYTGADNIPRTAAFTDPDIDGVFSADLLYVAPGSYTVDIVPPAGINVFTTSPAEPAALTVQADNTVTLAFTVTAASP